MSDLKNEEDEAQSIQQVDVSAEKQVKTKDPIFGWTATDRPLEIPTDILDRASLTRTSIIIFVRGVGVGLTHTEKNDDKETQRSEGDQRAGTGSGEG